MFNMGERAQLRPARSLMQGVPRMLDFMGVLSQKTPTRSAEEDMALAWREVLSVVKPAPPRRLAEFEQQSRSEGAALRR